MEKKVTYCVQFERWGRWIDYEYPFEDEGKLDQVVANARSAYHAVPDLRVRVRKTTVEMIYLGESEEITLKEDVADYLFG